MSMKKILLYGMNEADADLYQTIAIGYDIAMYIINDSCLSRSVGDLFQLNDDLESIHEAYAGEYMLMDGLSSDDLLELLKAFAEGGRPFPGVIVTRTKVNETWTLALLLEEVAKESTLMSRLKELDELMEDCNSVDFAAMDPKDSMELKQVLLESYLLFKDEHHDLAETEEMVRKLRKAMEPAVRIIH